MIRVTYSSVDGARSIKFFPIHAEARAFAVGYVGETPEFGRNYAISDDGIGKIEVLGCTLEELFA